MLTEDAELAAAHRNILRCASVSQSQRVFYLYCTVRQCEFRIIMINNAHSVLDNSFWSRWPVDKGIRSLDRSTHAAAFARTIALGAPAHTVCGAVTSSPNRPFCHLVCSNLGPDAAVEASLEVLLTDERRRVDTHDRPQPSVREGVLCTSMLVCIYVCCPFSVAISYEFDLLMFVTALVNREPAFYMCSFYHSWVCTDWPKIIAMYRYSYFPLVLLISISI